MEAQRKLFFCYQSEIQQLKSDLLKLDPMVSMIETVDESNFSQQNLTEIVINAYRNEDNYGIVFGLIFRNDKSQSTLNVELSAIKGHGKILYLKEYNIQHLFNDPAIIQDFKADIKDMVEVIIEDLRVGYSISIT